MKAVQMLVIALNHVASISLTTTMQPDECGERSALNRDGHNSANIDVGGPIGDGHNMICHLVFRS